MRRNSELTEQSAEMLTGGRAVVTEAAIRKWFHDIQAYTVEEEEAADLLQAPEQIFNFDESNILLARKKGNVLGPVKGPFINYVTQKGGGGGDISHCDDVYIKHTSVWDNV